MTLKALATVLIMFLATFAVMLNVKPSPLCLSTGTKLMSQALKKKSSIWQLMVAASGIQAGFLGINKKNSNKTH